MAILKIKPLRPKEICGLLRWLEENIGFDNFQFNHNLLDLVNGKSMDPLAYLAEWEESDLPTWAINNAKPEQVFLNLSEDHAIIYRLSGM